MTRPWLRLGCLLFVSMASCVVGTWAASDKPAAPPPTAPVLCPAGHVCLTVAEYEAQVKTASACLTALQTCRAKEPSHFGWCAGGGLSIGAMPTAEPNGSWQWQMTAGPTGSIIWGWRWR